MVVVEVFEFLDQPRYEIDADYRHLAFGSHTETCAPHSRPTIEPAASRRYICAARKFALSIKPSIIY